MAKTNVPRQTLPPVLPVTPAIPGLPPRYLPSAGTPSRVNVQEQRRAEQVTSAPGNNPPRYGDAPARPPFPSDSAKQPGVPLRPQAAGGSK